MWHKLRTLTYEESLIALNRMENPVYANEGEAPKKFVVISKDSLPVMIDCHTIGGSGKGEERLLGAFLKKEAR